MMPATLRACCLSLILLGAPSSAGVAAQDRAVAEVSAIPGEAVPGEARPSLGPSGMPLPRFVSLRAPVVNLRTGPGVRYPIDWVYKQAGLPLEVIDEFETWRRVRDWEGSTGWVHQSMLSGERKVMVTGGERVARRRADAAAAGVAVLEAGVIADLGRCEADWCLIEVGDVSGWLRRGELYGLDPDEAPR